MLSEIDMINVQLECVYFSRCCENWEKEEETEMLHFREKVKCFVAKLVGETVKAMLSR